jgi:hypothetical protein
MRAGTNRSFPDVYSHGAARMDAMSESDTMPDESGAPYLAFGALGSVALALYEYYARGNKQRGMFIGLWPPTMIGFAIYQTLQHEE